MPRPKQPPHPIEPFLLAKGLRPGSVRTYTAVVRRAEASGLSPGDWLRAEVNPAMPKRTLSVLRSVVAYMQEWTDGTPRAAANAALPVARAQPAGKLIRSGLDPEQLAAYHAAVEKEDEPFRTILKLLPRTGLRIAEMAGLATSEADYKANARAGHVLGGWVDLGARELNIVGKGGKSRSVPLTGTALNILSRYIDERAPAAPWLFWMNEERPDLNLRRMETRDVERVTLRLAKENPDTLAHLSPHVLRHTVATGMLDADVNVKLIQEVLGHSSIQTLQPYLHTNIAQRRAALEKGT